MDGSKNREKIKCLGLVWEWFGGVGEAIGKKAPAGAHLVAPSLDNTDSAYVRHRNTDSVYVIHRNLCLRHRPCVYLQHRNSVCTTYKLCICNIVLVSLKHIICMFETYNLYLRGMYLSAIQISLIAIHTFLPLLAR